MSTFWRVTSANRERIAREFDDRGPEICVAEVIGDLRQRNPELLDMATRCATSLGDYRKIMCGFGMFYRLMLGPEAPDPRPSALSVLPRVTPQTRERVVRLIDREGAEAFTMDIIEDLERSNPELLQMAHDFASGQMHFLPLMQGFALLYKSLLDQMTADRACLQ